MKFTKSLLAVMAVAVMLIAPMAVAVADAEKVPATDAEKGFYIVNDGNVTSLEKLGNVGDVSDMMIMIRTAFGYLNQDILNFILGIKVTSIDVTTYERDEYQNLNGFTTEYGTSQTIVGTFDITLTTTNKGYFFKEDPSASDGDLLKEANMAFGEVKSGEKIDAKVTITFKLLSKTVATYDEAKDKYVAKTVYEENITSLKSSSSFKISDDKNMVYIDYNYNDIKKVNDSYDCSVYKDVDAPADCYCTGKATDEITNFVNSGKIADKRYSADLMREALNESAKKYADAYTHEAEWGPTLKAESLQPSEDLTLAKATGTASEDAAKAKLAANGFSGASDYSRAKAGFDNAYSEFNTSGGSSGFPTWAIIVIAVAIILVLVGIVLYLKKSGKI